MRTCAVIVSTCLLVIISAVARGQQPAAQPAEKPARATVDESLGTIEKRDLLRVRIDGLKPPPAVAEKWIRVDDDGSAALPHVGGRKLAGMTTAQAEADIANAYLDAGVIRDARVDVRRIEVGSRVKEGAGKLARGDLVAVTVDDLTGPGATAEFRAHVGADGEVPVPLLGAPKLGGMTQGQAEQAVAREFEKRGFIRNAVVGVRVVESSEGSKLNAGPIARGDLLSVTVYDLAGPGVRSDLKARVGADGAVGFPLIGTVTVDGLSEAKAVDAIVKALRDNNVAASAMVSVLRLESADRANVKIGPVAPGEVLRVSLMDLAGPGVETVKTAKVAANGQIAMPLAGAIKVDGLTEADAARAIAKAYADKHLISGAQVTVLKVNGAALLTDEEVEPLPAAAPASERPRQARGKKQQTGAR